MKIEGNRPTQETESLTRADAKGQKPTPNRAADSGDRVDVSADAKKAQGLVADAVKAANSLPDVRAEALAHAQVEGLLASEGALEFALAELPPMQGLDTADRDTVRRELEAAERAL